MLLLVTFYQSNFYLSWIIYEILVSIYLSRFSYVKKNKYANKKNMISSKDIINKICL